MSNTKNSFSSLIAQFLRLQKNSLEIINKLNDVTTSSKDSVEIEFLMDDNTSENIQVPSFGFLKTEINRLDQNIKALSGLEDNRANVRNADGTVSKIYQARTLKDPLSPSSLQVPGTFQARNNWFFESFLNPLLYIEIDVENQIPGNSENVYIKRIIANTQSDVQKQYFDNNIKGRNDITDSDFIASLQSQGIQYFVDEQINSLELRTIRYTGSFGVLRIFDEELQTSVNGITTTNTVRKYKLNTLKYNDVLSDTENSRTLTKGDLLITNGGTKYEITSIDVTNQAIVVKRLFGFEAIQIGNSSLTIYSNVLSNRQVEVNVGFDERQGVFIKSIDGDFNVASSKYSPGIFFWSNELQITTSDGVKTLQEFYNSQVSDFSKIFIASAKDNTIPAIYGQTPSAPVVSPGNFKVVRVNSQITNSKESVSFNDKIKTKNTIKNEIDSIDRAIDQTRKQISELTTTSAGNTPTAEYKKLNDKINSLTKDKATKIELISTTISDINNLIITVPEITESPKYRVRGFWPIPEPIIDPKTGEQNIVQFNVRYRYLSTTGNPNGVDQIDYIDNNGVQKTGQFTNWTQFKSDVRKKIYDINTGTYVWQIEDVSDANTVNINQLDIPITKGEKVEIQVQSISEAGWPTNPLTSDWSTSAIINFPPDLVVQVENSAFAVQNNTDTAVSKIQSDLQAKGLDQHLSTQFTSGDKFFAHNSSVISSGFFDATGKALDLFQKLTQIDNELQSLRALIAKAKGTLGVYLRSGNTSNKINPGSTINLFAGYYDQIIDLTNPSNRGKIASIVYYIELRNEAATPLELSSLIPGGQGVKAPNTIVGQSDYNNNRKYGNTPVQLSGIANGDVDVTTPGSFIQASGYQSANAYSQFVYNRYKSVGLDQDLYFVPPASLTWNPNTGNTINGSPVNNDGIIMPYDPSGAPIGSGPSANIWIGTYTGANPNGNGNLNEFCIHISHPDINDGTSSSFGSLARPSVLPTGPMEYPSFRHALGFETDTNINGTIPGFQNASYQQLEYYPANSSSSFGTDDNAYPNKLGFVESDEFLCGKFSCGSYLFLAPTNHTSVQIEGSTQLAKKTLDFGQENSITIPLVFQMRAQDKMGYVGGWRSAGNLKNITYTKKIGIDIQVKNEDLFSFDVLVTGSYTKTSLVSPAYSQSKKTTI
ncbi:MAG: hypothetical protein EBS19_03475 [Spirochaetia bacterium]|nr:hypothetical protein [Spirochaetia bacterium]